MRTYRFSLPAGSSKTLPISFTRPSGTVNARVIATDATGATETLSDAATLSANSIALTIPSSYVTTSRFPAKFVVEIQIDGGAWKPEVEARGVLDVPEEEEADSAAVAAVDAKATTALTTVGTKEDRLTLAGLPIFAYGASYSTLNQQFFTAGKHYLQQVKDACGGGTVTSYGVNGRRALDIATHLLSSTMPTGITGAVAGAVWPGTTARRGLVVHDALGNDIMNQAAMNAASHVLQAISGTAYTNYLKQHYRATLALMSTESRIENHAHSAAVGAWTHETAGFASGGTTCFTTTVGDYVEYSVTPPQSGPMAGKVFVVLVGDIPTNLQYATTAVSVDGGAATNHSPLRHTYVGQNGATVKGMIMAIPVTVPIDGNAHTIRIAHAGTAGHYLIVDSILIPSVSPNTIACMGVEHPMTVVSGFFDADDVRLYNANSPLVHAAYKEVVAEFPHAVYVASTITSNGLWTGDGIHLNDRGNAQRANDLIIALRHLKARFANIALQSLPNSDFAKV